MSNTYLFANQTNSSDCWLILSKCDFYRHQSPHSFSQLDRRIVQALSAKSR